MQNPKLIFIAGDRAGGGSEIESRTALGLSDLIGMFSQATREQPDATLDQAHQAQVELAVCGIKRKYSELMAIGTEMMTRAEELGTWRPREQRKPLAEVYTIAEISQTSTGRPL
ncbi:MAG: hypothetical protein JKY00_06695 [Roseicyclus sp.]|nr:hypothetical protein [Roseicyclus sp.]